MGRCRQLEPSKLLLHPEHYDPLSPLRLLIPE